MLSKDIKFVKEDLLSYEELKKVITEKIAINKAKIISSKLNKTLIIQGNEFYLYDRIKII